MLLAKIEKTAVSELSVSAESEVNRIFKRLQGTHLGWRANMKSQTELDNAKSEWLRLLVKHALNAKEIERGLNLADTDKNPYLPSFGQFLEWCKTIDYAELGLPNVEQLLKRLDSFSHFSDFEELHKFKFRSNAEYWLLAKLYERRRKYGWSEETLLNQAEKALLAVAKEIQAGKQFPEPTITLPEKSESYRPPIDVIDKRFSELKMKMGIRQ